MTRRLRIGAVVCHAVLQWDDGENLEPGPESQAVSVPLSQLKGSPYYDKVVTDLAAAEAQLLGQETAS